MMTALRQLRENPKVCHSQASLVIRLAFLFLLKESRNVRLIKVSAHNKRWDVLFISLFKEYKNYHVKTLSDLIKELKLSVNRGE